MRAAVIGSGIIGAAVADALAARGVRVVIYDMRSPGGGASQASAGVLSPFIEAKPGSPLLAMGRQSLAMWDAFVDGVRSRSGGASFEYARTGTLEVALAAEQEQALRGAAAWLRAEGIDHEWLEGTALREREPSVTHAALGGLLIPQHGFVNVRALVTALMHAARLSGAISVTPREILQVEQKADRVHLRVGAGEDVFDHVVIAAGSWTRRVRVAGEPAFPIKPIRGQLLHLRWAHPVRPQRSVWGTRCYTVPWADGSVLVGATVEDVGFDERSTVAGVRELMEAVVELLPGAASAGLEGVRVGLRPAADAPVPLLGPLPNHPRVIMAAGHYRNGILLAPLTAERVVRAVLDADHSAM